jgi:peptide/nickel transport system ATP-binding protein
MYAGEIVEQAPTAEVFENPQHPYTQGLLDSIPKISVGMGSGIEGQLPDYTEPPNACRFADRCPHAANVCREVFPYSRKTTDDHDVACHLYEGEPAHERHESIHYNHDIHLEPSPKDRTEESNVETREVTNE